MIDHFAETNQRMHEAMAISPTGDIDHDFVQGMVAHHRGAVEMAEVVLEHGDDPEIRALAEDIIQHQEAELRDMREWLSRNGS